MDLLFDLISFQFIKGFAFVPFYLTLMFVGERLIGSALRYSLLGSDRTPRLPRLDADAIAWLKGRNDRVFQVAMARLLTSKVIEVGTSYPNKIKLLQPSSSEHPVESLILEAARAEEGNELYRVRQRVAQNFSDQLQQKLTQAELVATTSAGYRYAWARLAITATIAAIGSTRWVIGLSNGKPVGFLTVCLFFYGLLGFGLAVARFSSASIGMTTPRGEEILQKLEDDNAALKTSTIAGSTLSCDDIALATALFGATVLPAAIGGVFSSQLVGHVGGQALAGPLAISKGIIPRHVHHGNMLAGFYG